MTSKKLIKIPDANGYNPIDSDADEWCGVFVYDCLQRANIPVTRTEGAWQSPALSSFYMNNWAEGTEIENPVYGAIVRFNHSHVAIVVGFTETTVTYIGGNQQPAPALDDGRGTEVNVTTRNRSTVDGYRLPANYKAPAKPTNEE